MSLDLSTVAVGVLSGIPVSLVSWGLLRAIKGIDKSIENLVQKVDGLTLQDTKILVEIAELRTRITHLEFVVLSKKKKLQTKP